LILGKITKIVATRYNILQLKCTIFAWGAYSTPPNPLPGFKGPTSKGKKGRGRGRGKGRGKEGKKRA